MRGTRAHSEKITQELPQREAGGEPEIADMLEHLANREANKKEDDSVKDRIYLLYRSTIICVGSE